MSSNQHVKITMMTPLRVMHLGAVQGSDEEQVNRIQTYGERVPQEADVEMHQKRASQSWLCRDWVARGA